MAEEANAPGVSLSEERSLALDTEWTERILTQFIRVEVRRTGLSRVVLGLSGGIDSALSAFLAARALGPENVDCIQMPYRASSPSSLSDAQQVVDALGTGSETVDITPIVDGFIAAAGQPGALRLGNVMSRARMTVLYDRSAAAKALVVGTSNKTELLLGYGTLYGDMASALNPLGDLYKTQVRELSAALGVPQSILDKAPSADLEPDQSDEHDLGFSYDEADRLLSLLVDARVSRETAIAAGFRTELVDRVTRMIVRSQFKRKMPLIAKVSLRSLGWDFRYPRDWLS